MHKSTKACDIPYEVKKKVWERDHGRCVICGTSRMVFPNAHYIARSHMGLGIEQNIVCLCLGCHCDYDNGSKREEYGAAIRRYLKAKYRGWDESKLVYRKYGEIEDFYRSLNAENKQKVMDYINELAKEKNDAADDIYREPIE